MGWINFPKPKRGPVERQKEPRISMQNGGVGVLSIPLEIAAKARIYPGVRVNGAVDPEGRKLRIWPADDGVKVTHSKGGRSLNVRFSKETSRLIPLPLPMVPKPVTWEVIGNFFQVDLPNIPRVAAVA